MSKFFNSSTTDRKEKFWTTCKPHICTNSGPHTGGKTLHIYSHIKARKHESEKHGIWYSWSADYRYQSSMPTQLMKRMPQESPCTEKFPHTATDQSRTHVCIRHPHAHGATQSGWYGSVSEETPSPPWPHASGTHTLLYAMVSSHNTRHPIHSSDDRIHTVKCIPYHSLSKSFGI